MTSDTLRTRLSQLLTKSRKAAYLYQHTARESQGLTGAVPSGVESGDVSGAYLRNQKPTPVTHQRGAARSHSHVEAAAVAPEKRFSHLQVVVWQHVNENLSRSLRSLLQKKVQRCLSQGALDLRDELYESWRRAETELHREKLKLERAIAEEQYVRSAILAERLITLKARFQATKAAYSEYEVAVADVTRRDFQGSNEGQKGDKFSGASQDGYYRERRVSLAKEADREDMATPSSASDIGNVLPFSEVKRRNVR